MIQRLECSVGEEGDSHANTGTPASTGAEADSDATPSRAQTRRDTLARHRMQHARELAICRWRRFE